MEKKIVSSPTCIFNHNKQITRTNYKGEIGNIYLYRLVFSHGQLYVALSWSTKQENTKVTLAETGKNSKHCAETGSGIK